MRLAETIETEDVCGGETKGARGRKEIPNRRSGVLAERSKEEAVAGGACSMLTRCRQLSRRRDGKRFAEGGLSVSGKFT